MAWLFGFCDGEEDNRKLEKLTARVGKLENKLLYLEQKEDPAITKLLEEASSLGLSLVHTGYNTFRNLEEYNSCISYPGYIPPYPTYTLNDIYRLIQAQKAIKFDECRKAGKCDSSGPGKGRKK